MGQKRKNGSGSIYFDKYYGKYVFYAYVWSEHKRVRRKKLFDTLEEAEACANEYNYQDDNPCFVYFVSDGHGHIKIGMSKNIKTRMHHLQNASPYDLTLLGSLEVGQRELTYELENDIHRELKEKQMRKEWFAMSDEEAIEVIKKYQEDWRVK